MTNTINYEVFCKAWLDSWSGNRPQELIKFYRADAFYSDPSKRNGLLGHAELLPYFEKLLRNNPNWKWEPAEIIPTQKGFTLKWKARIPVSDSIVEETGLDIVEISHGLISRNEVYFDRLNWMEALKQIK
ncbi:MAG TPA: nuclear transport factor 2 family protein [Chitinophagales bacterium]|nr:nuclear transport factor 2 family protein [Chitinophagales bacterium]